MTLDESITELYELKQERAVLNKQVDKLTATIEEKTKELIDKILATGLKSITGSHARATVHSEQVPTINDWDTFMASDAAVYMVQKRISVRPFEEYLNAYGQPPPGLEAVKINKLSFTKN